MDDADGAASTDDGGSDVTAPDSADVSDAAVPMDADPNGALDGSNSVQLDGATEDAAAMLADEASIDVVVGDASDDLEDGAPLEATTPPVDHCMPNPCERGAACTDHPAGFSCDCPSGSTGDRCELEICGDTTIRTDADLRASRLCAEVRGNLQIATSGLVAIDASHLPHLTKVTGDLRIAALNGSAATPVVQSMTFVRLQAVEGTLFVGATSPGSVAHLYFPALTTVGGGADTARRLHLELAPDVRVLELPVLATV